MVVAHSPTSTNRRSAIFFLFTPPRCRRAGDRYLPACSRFRICNVFEIYRFRPCIAFKAHTYQVRSFRRMQRFLISDRFPICTKRFRILLRFRMHNAPEVHNSSVAIIANNLLVSHAETINLSLRPATFQKRFMPHCFNQIPGARTVSLSGTRDITNTSTRAFFFTSLAPFEKGLTRLETSVKPFIFANARGGAVNPQTPTLETHSASSR